MGRRVRWLWLWDLLRGSYWFIPAVMAALAVALAFSVVHLDRATGGTADPGWIYTGGPSGARGVLSIVASSVMSTAGVVFSITIAALSLASQQFGPRLLSGFMRDRGNQVVLGTFISTFLYCLLVIRTVRGGDEGEPFVPNLAVTTGVALGVASLGVLIYFIHHLAVSIQAPQVIASAARELRAAVDAMPRPAGGPPAGPGAPPRPLLPADAGWTEVRARGEGYLQAIDEDGLADAARALEAVVAVAVRPGGFVGEDAVLARVSCGAPNERALRRLRRCFILGARQTSIQNARFGVRQLVEVAVRALSPGTNDPFTAIGCLDRLGAELCHAARRGMPPRHRLDRGGRVRVVHLHATSLDELVHDAITPIRQYGAGSVPVLVRLLEVLRELAGCRGDAAFRAALLREADLAVRAARRMLGEPLDRAEVERAHAAVVQALAGDGDSLAAPRDPQGEG